MKTPRLPVFVRLCDPTMLAPLALVALAAPAAAQYTSSSTDISTPIGDYLGTDDVAITPDGQYAVFRDTSILTQTKVLNLVTGVLELELMSTLGPDCSSFGDPGCSGPCNDAVVVTNQRAITLGQSVQLIDLIAQPPVQLAEYDFGLLPRDVAVTENGRLAIIRGGRGPSGGTYVLDVINGTVLLFSPSQPRDFSAQLGNDLAAAAEFHGVTLAYDEVNDETDILVVEFAPASGTGPRVVLDTAASVGFPGDPMDVAISPDGQFATVRTTEEVVLVRLDGTNTAVVRTFNSFPGGTLPFATTATDTVVSTDSLWATITIGNGTTSDGYINLQNLTTGQDHFAFIDGAPRDLVLTPDNESLLVHTSRKIYRFDLTNLPASPLLNNTTFRNFPATAAGLLAGIDSVAATNERAIVMAPDGLDTRVRIYDLTQGTTPVFTFGTLMTGRPVDVDIAPDGSYAIAVTLRGYLVVDLRTDEERLRVIRPGLGSPSWPWSDGAAAHPMHLMAGGIDSVNFAGWAESIDLVSREDLSCESLPNSTGSNGDLFALGSTRIAENDLILNARFLPSNVFGAFFLGSGMNQTPVGAGILCLGGTFIRLPVVTSNSEGIASLPVDLTNLPPAGAGIVVGSTWFAQMAHRDTPTAAGNFNYTNASSLLFE